MTAPGPSLHGRLGGGALVAAAVLLALTLALPVTAVTAAATAAPGSLSHPAPALVTGAGIPSATPVWPTGPGSRPLSASSASDWPELHQDPQLTGGARSSSLSTANTPGLGVAWDADLYGAALDSPVVAYDPLLHESVAYIGTESGGVLALNAATGQNVWGAWLGSPVLSSPAVHGDSLFVATSRSPALYRLNATTGAEICSYVAPESIAGSPTVFTASGRTPTVFVGTEDTNTHSGPLLAVNASTCALEWQFTGYPQLAGSWDPVAATVNRTGAPLVLFGTADPDASVYALNASTGREVWRFHTHNPPPGVYDVGAGVTISPPGANGFRDGVAYVPNKFGIMYALDLSTGALLWKTNFNQLAKVTEGGRSTAALSGENLVFGYNGGLFDLNASTGVRIWKYALPSGAEVISSPAIAGQGSTAIVVAGDVAGGVEVVALRNGTPLYQYTTGGYITASPAVDGRNMLIASTDGFLYDFAPGGGNARRLPSTTVLSPANGVLLPHPSGPVVIRGTAADAGGVLGVIVGVQTGGPTGPWWDATAGGWSPGPFGNAASGNRTTNGTSLAWSLDVPAPSAGDAFSVHAYAISASGQSDVLGAEVQFAVNYSTSGPHLRAYPSFVPPGSPVTVLGGGFAPRETVDLSLAGTHLASVVVSSTGYLAAVRVTVPTTAAFGATALNATGTASGRSAEAPLTVANSWEQFGGSPAHEGFAPNDPTLDNLITPGNLHWVDLAWHFDAGAAIEGSPALSDGVAYVGTAAGELYALDDRNGGLLWNWSDAT
ncbi:MAG TPA: PQQ-binding-like beta-propeller repeat protein, partial [Thermoplasmata archaeon]|nr:PQQ-binding-like beta-propeller repeat protein [Thermoplasmata archaeon]